VLGLLDGTRTAKEIAAERLELYRGGKGRVPRAFVVDDALCCETCSPRPDPVDLPELDG
jgi:hypothetical protein